MILIQDNRSSTAEGLREFRQNKGQVSFPAGK